VIRAFRAEWYKLMRPGIIIGGAGTMIALAILTASLIFANAQAPGATPTQGGGGGGPGGPGGLPATAVLAQSTGMVAAFGFAGALIGVVVLVLFAQSVGNEYRDGTLKMLLSREPRRLRLLAGKLAAMSLLVAAGILAAFAAQTLVAAGIAGARGIPTSAWWTQDGWDHAAAVVSRTYVVALVDGLLGTALAVLFRAAAPAIGVGIGYTLVGENIFLLVWREGQNWLPGQVMQAFSRGGTPSLTMAAASWLVLGYAALFVLVSGSVFWRRDVAG